MEVTEMVSAPVDAAGRESLVSKIQKLMALGTSTNQNEAESAMLKAQQLMAEAGLSAADIGLSKKQKKQQATGKIIDPGRTVTDWKLKLANVVAQNFRCECFLTIGRGITIVGVPEDIEVVEALWEGGVKFAEYAAAYFVWDVYRLSDEFKLQIARGKSQSSILRAARQSWYLGFINGLRQKFADQLKSNPEWLPVLVKPEAVVEYMDSIKLRNRNTSTNYNSSKSAYQDGFAKGREYEDRAQLPA
jgi:hypothetical protein